LRSNLHTQLSTNMHNPKLFLLTSAPHDEFAIHAGADKLRVYFVYLLKSYAVDFALVWVFNASAQFEPETAPGISQNFKNHWKQLTSPASATSKT
jgi:hypothetical protein